MPRPSKFTAAVREAFLTAIKFGASIRTAAAEAGIGHQTALRWLEQGKSAPPDSPFGKFHQDYETARAAMPMHALRSVWDGVAAKPELALKVLQTMEEGWAPPMPSSPHTVQTGPVVVNLSLAGPQAVPNWIDAEVSDATEIPALGDGGGPAAPTAAT